MQSNKFADIFRKYRCQLVSFIQNRTSDVEAEDVVQDVFLRLMETDSTSPVTQVASWLYQAARNKIIDNSRKRKEERMPEPSISKDGEVCIQKLNKLLMDDDKSPEKELLRNAVWEELEQALEELPDEQRYVFEQTEFEGRSFKELSEETGTSVNTLISRKHYAVKYLRQELAEIYEDLIYKG